MRSVRGRPKHSFTILAIAAMLLAGCGSDQPDTPSACFGPARDYVSALEEAPEPVRLADSTPISDCLAPDQDPGDVARVGEEMINAATELNARARRDPSGEATVRLGYLIGAAQQGAADIHTDLLRRLDTAARFTQGGEVPPASFERAFGEGYAAGQETG